MIFKICMDMCKFSESVVGRYRYPDPYLYGIEEIFLILLGNRYEIQNKNIKIERWEKYFYFLIRCTILFLLSLDSARHRV